MSDTRLGPAYQSFQCDSPLRTLPTYSPLANWCFGQWLVCHWQCLWARLCDLLLCRHALIR